MRKESETSTHAEPVRSMKDRRPDAKVPVLFRKVRELALEKESHAKLPTVTELCQQFQTSSVTIKEVLKELEKQNVIYRKAGSGIFVSPKLKQTQIAVLLESTRFTSPGASPLWSMLWGIVAQEVQRRATQYNEAYSYHLFSTEPGQEVALPETVIRQVQMGQIHGALAIHADGKACDWLDQHGVCCVSFHCGLHRSVAIDSMELMRLGIAHLAQRGCRRVTIWAPAYPPSDRYAHKYPLEAFLPYLFAAYGLEYDPTLVRRARDPELPLQEQGYQVAYEAFQEQGSAKPDGILITDDMMTDGALVAFLSLGVQVGNEVQVVTHANAGSKLFFNHVPGLTILEFDPAEIVRNMFWLFDQLRSDDKPEQDHIVLAPRFRVPGAETESR